MTSNERAGAELLARPERRLIGRGGDSRHVDFAVRVTDVPRAGRSDRLPLTLALVIDRSGSMSGAKLPTAKRAALAVLDRLELRDSVAVVVFDEVIDTVQEQAPATADLKARVRARLDEIHARGSTALHEGWLTGCQAITRDDVRSGARLARCFLLTDGQANVGLQDPERIASEARGVRERAGISTSTFGIGEDYAEELLGPMAEGGSGQFHHLRGAAEIASTFVGELGEMLAVALTQARLELRVRPGVTVDVVSVYSARPVPADDVLWTVSLGDLLAGDEQHVIVRFDFPAQDLDGECPVRARLVWQDDGAERTTDWHEVRFAYASAEDCATEAPDAAVAQLVGERLADRTRRESIRLSKGGDLAGARAMIAETQSLVSGYAAYSPALSAELDDLNTVREEMVRGPLPSGISKERYFQAQRRSSGKRDQRGSPPPPEAPQPNAPPTTPDAGNAGEH